MHPHLRGESFILLILCSLSTLTGCREYNVYQPAAEAESITQVTQLTSGFDRAGSAVFSRDQRWLLFLASKAQTSPGQTLQLYLAKLNWQQNGLPRLEHPIRISPDGSRNLCGSFSPQDISLIFCSTAGSITPASTAEPVKSDPLQRFPIDMRLYRFDDWEGMVSMTDAVTGLDLAKHALSVDRAYTGECSFSTNGKWICFTSNRDGQLNLYGMHADGSHLVRITRTIGSDGGGRFSPDGKHLLYHSDRNAEHLSQIYLADLSFDAAGEITGMSAERQLSDDQNVNTNPAWHPDGTHIIYTTSRHGRDNYELYLMNSQGRKKTRITYCPGADLFPSFSPDGKYLAWASRRTKDATVQIYLAEFHFPRGS